MAIASDGTITEERAQTPVGNTACVPSGTLLTVPAAPPTGATGQSPVVAANTVPWYKDPAFLSAAGGALYALSEPVVQALTQEGPINWRSLALGCLLALIAWFRNRHNTVVR